MAHRFRETGLDAPFVRRMTERGDDLRRPLEPTREARYTDHPAAAALRMFFCREETPLEEAAGALGSALLHGLRDCGLLIESNPGHLVSPFHLRIVRGMYLFSDYLAGDANAVMGAGETTAILFQAGRPTRQVARALDLGCGAGTLALLLAAGAEQAVGTDINPRAIAIARLNAAVNGIENADFRVGDVYAPVEDERFDVILSQPPYYPKPKAGGASGEQVFLHGGERGDELSLRVVEGVPRHLAPGGRAVIFTSWPEMAGRISSGRLRVLELKTNRRELHGMRQSINVIEHAEDGRGWSAAYEVPADRWGSVESRRIEQLMAGESLLRGPREALLGARLRLPGGAHPVREGTHLFLHTPHDSLVSFASIDEDTWQVLAAVHDAADVRSALQRAPSFDNALELVRRALRRGLIGPAEPVSTDYPAGASPAL